MFPSKFHQHASSHCDQVKISFRRWTMKNSKSFSRWNLDLALQLPAQALSWDGCVLFLSDSVCWVILYPPCVGAPKSDKRLEFWGCPRDEQTWISLSEALHSLKQGLTIQSLWFVQILQPFCIGSSQIWAELTNNRDCKNASRSSHKEVPSPSLQASVLPCACFNRKLSDMKEHEPSVKEW